MKKIFIIMIMFILFGSIIALGAEPGCGDMEYNEEMNNEDEFYSVDENSHPIIGAGLCWNDQYLRRYNINNFQGYNLQSFIQVRWDCDIPAREPMRYGAQTIAYGKWDPQRVRGSIRLYSSEFDKTDSSVGFMLGTNNEKKNPIFQATISLPANVYRPWVVYSDHTIIINGVTKKFTLRLPNNNNK